MKKLIKLFLSFLIAIPSLSFAAQTTEKYVGEPSVSEMNRLSQVPVGTKTTFTAPNQVVYEGVLTKVTYSSAGEPQFHFEGSVPVRVLPVTGSNAGVASYSDGGGNSPSATSESGSGTSIATGAVRGAATGAAIYIIGEIFKPSPKTEAELQKALKDFEKSRQDLETQISTGQGIASNAIQKADGILKEVQNENEEIPVWKNQTSTLDFSAINNPLLAKRGQELWEKFGHYQPRSQMQADLKNLGIAAVKSGFDFGIEKDEKAADKAFDIAAEIAGALFGLNPVTSLIQDSYSLFYGKDIFSGKKLRPIDRALAGVSMMLTVATGGLATPLETAVMTSFKISKYLKSPMAQRSVREISDVIKKYEVFGKSLELQENWLNIAFKESFRASSENE